jgi:penicillin-binding protein 2
LPRTVPLVEPVSSADAGFFRSGSFYLRIGGLAVLCLVALSALALRLWSLEVLHGPQYVRQAQQQSYRTVDLPGARGAIVDSKGRLLAGLDGRLALTADSAALGAMGKDGRWWPDFAGRRTLDRLSELTHVPRAAFVSRIRRGLVRSPFAPAVVMPQLLPDVADFLDERTAEYPGLKVIELPTRRYPQGGLGSEFLGLLGEVSQKQLDEPAYSHAKPGEVVGTSGVEADYDRILNGGFQRARVRVDSRGRIVGPLRPVASRAIPPTLRLTVDARIQRAAERALRDGIALAHANGHMDASAGAAVVMNPRTGGLYALASYPDYNQVLAAHDPSYYARLLRAPTAISPLYDRATQGIYPTGSTFKPIVAEAALSAGLITPWTPILCSGSFTVGNHVFHNVEAGANAYLNLPQALEISCDTWFYRLGAMFYEHGGNGMQTWARKLGLGRSTGLDLPDESTGIVPTPAWLQRTYKENWWEGQSVNLAIGQGYLAVTPLQLAVAYSALANGGTVVQPHVADAVVNGKSIHTLRFPPRSHVALKDLWAIRQGLFQAAHGSGGTSTAVFGNFPIPVAGKTGTAQAPPGSDHSWYASWAPAGNPRVVVVVLIEHGGFGAEAAAPAAREIYSAFFRLNGQARQ